MGNWVYVRNKKTKAGQPGWWPESKKIEAVTAYLSLGSMPLAAATTKLPLNTIQHWKKQPWWKELEQKIRDEDNQELDSKFTSIIKKTLTVIEDRLENGNYQFDPKTGRVLRIPVNIRDTHRVMSDLVNQRRVVRKEPVREEKQDSVNERLLGLAEQFAQFALGKQKDDLKVVGSGEVYDGDFTGSEDSTDTPETSLEASGEDNVPMVVPTPTQEQTNGS